VTAVGLGRAQSYYAARHGSAALPMQADGRSIISALGTQCLERPQTLRRAGVAALTEPPQGMTQAPVAGIVHIVGRQNMQARRQGSDPQPVAAMDDDRTVLVGADDIAAGIRATIELPSGRVNGHGRGRTAEQLPRQQPTA